jgi:polysaccharide biosynthesis protein PslE
MTDSQSWTLWDCLYALYRFKFRALGVFALVLVAGIFWVQSLPHQFESDAMLFVRLGWENASLDPTGKQDAASANSSSESEISTMIEHLRSRQILEKAMDLVMPISDGESRENREKAFNSFKNRITITSPKASMVIRIAAKANRPEDAQKIVATVTDLYLDEHLRLSRPAGSYEFLSQHSNRLRAEFEAAQVELRDAKNKIGLASIDGRRASLESQIGELETKINEVTAALLASEAKMKNLDIAINALPDPLLKQMVGGTPNDGFAEMRARLFELQVQREELGSKFTKAHPLYAAVERQVDEIESILQREAPNRSEIIRSISASENAAQAAMKAQLESLGNQLAKLQESLTDLNNNETNVAILTLKLSHIQNRYVAYDAKAEDARIEEDLLKEKLSNVRVIQPASFALLPVGPQKTSLILFVMVCGIVGGSVIALLSEHFDRYFKQGKGLVRNRPFGERQQLSHLPGMDGTSPQGAPAM